jgi:hypothetical protein
MVLGTLGSPQQICPAHVLINTAGGRLGVPTLTAIIWQ